MALFSITDAQLAFGHVALLDHTDFSLEAGERVGLIGRNGTGKSSLLKIVAGTTAPDDGLIARQSGVTSAYVPQEPVFDPDQTVAQAVAMGVPHAAGLLADYEADLDLIENASTDTAVRHALAEWPGEVRGFGGVRQGAADRVAAKRDKLRSHLS